MYFRIILSAILLCAATTFLKSQQISVQSFSIIENDLSARVKYPKIDQNGNLAALIKVVTTQTGFEFDGGMLGIVAVEQKMSEIWVYVPGKAKTITIKHPQLGILRNYTYPIPIESGQTYEMKLVTGSVETIVRPVEIPTQWIIIESQPPGADVYINEQPMGQTPYQSELPLGRYTYRLVKELFQPEAGAFELKDKTGKEIISVTLNPNYGEIYLSSSPEQGAEVTLNGVKIGKTTPCTLEQVPAGENTITLKREWYATTTKNVKISAGQKLPLTITMEPTFVNTTIKTDEDAEIFINGTLRGKGSLNIRLNPGVYTFEARKKNHRNATEKRTVEKGKNFELNLYPSPITGTLKVITTPHDAEIFLNGKSFGKTPITLRNILIGEYNLELRKNNYAIVFKTIAIEEGKITEVNETLTLGKEITIITDPPDADVYINKKKTGKTPLKIALPFGTYQLKVANSNLEIEESINVSQSGQTVWEFNLNLSKKITIESNQPSKVYINDKLYGNTPITTELKYGKYELRLVPHDSDYESVTQVLEVNDQTTSTEEVYLSLTQEALKRKIKHENYRKMYERGNHFIDVIYTKDRDDFVFLQGLTLKGIWGVGYVGSDTCYFIPPLLIKMSMISNDNYPPIFSSYFGFSCLGEMMVHPKSVTFDYFSMHVGIIATNLSHRLRFMAEVSGGLKGRSTSKKFYLSRYDSEYEIIRDDFLSKELQLSKLPWAADCKASLDIYLAPRFAITIFGGVIYTRKLKWWYHDVTSDSEEIPENTPGLPQSPFIEGINTFYGIGVRLF